MFVFSLTDQHDKQKVDFAQAVISDRDGEVKFQMSTDLVAMESHIVSDNVREDNVIIVPSYSVKTLAAKYSVPKHFGILSIDAEGHSSQVFKAQVLEVVLCLFL